MSRPRNKSIDNLPPINKRLLEFIEAIFEGSREAFCERTSMSVRSLPNYFGSKPNIPATPIIEQWKLNMPEFNLNWLIGGNGSMLEKNSYDFFQHDSEKKTVFRDIENSAIGTNNQVSRDSATLNVLIESLKAQINVYDGHLDTAKITISSLQKQVLMLERENDELRDRLENKT